jgi:hypothetical protein
MLVIYPEGNQDPSSGIVVRATASSLTRGALLEHNVADVTSCLIVAFRQP